MIARVLLLLSNALGVLIGVGFIAGGIYGAANPNLASDLAKKLNFGAVPQAEKIKNNILVKFNESGLAQAVWRTFLIIGSIITSICGLGLLAAILAWKSLLIIYIIVQLLLLATFATTVLLLFDEDSIIGRKITDKLVAAQDTKFVSLVALLDGNAGNAAVMTVIINVIQATLGCCGMRSVGDIRSSSSWQASSRNLAGLLKLAKDGGGGGSGLGTSGAAGLVRGIVGGDAPLIQSDGNVPDWMRNRIPPGSTLPPGVNLPDKLPDGIIIPKQFNITDLEILKNATAIRQLFEKSLVLLTPVSCCKLKYTQAITKFNSRELVASMSDPTCPFSAENGPGVYTEACYRRAIHLAKGYAAGIIISSVIIALFMMCNLTLALQILFCG